MYDKTGWKPHHYSDYDSGSESQPLLSSDASHASRRSFGATTFMFPDSETSDFESNTVKKVTTTVPTPRPKPPELFNASRRPFVYRADSVVRKSGCSWDEQMSAMTYNRFQYYSKLRTYALDDSALAIPDHVLPFTYFVPYSSGVQPKGDSKQSSLVTIFSVWNTIMGSSLLTMPWGIQNAGLLMGIITIVMMGGLCLYTTHKILQVQLKHGKANADGEVAELATMLLGQWAGYIAKLFSLLVLLGAVIVYWILMTNFLYHSVDYVYETVTHTALSQDNNSLPAPSVLCPQDEAQSEASNTTSYTDSPQQIFNKVWGLTTTVPIFIIFIIGPLINFRSVTFFTKFNSLGK